MIYFYIYLVRPDYIYNFIYKYNFKIVNPHVEHIKDNIPLKLLIMKGFLVYVEWKKDKIPGMLSLFYS